VLLIGIPGAGKSTFYRARFAATHQRVNLDELRSRTRERDLVRACLASGRPFVVDNTNVRRMDRAPYIEAAKAAGFAVTGYYFPCELREALARNEARAGRSRIPRVALVTKAKRLEPPLGEEGFTSLHTVHLGAVGEFVVDGAPLTAETGAR
jgi:predicted kinase